MKIFQISRKDRDAYSHEIHIVVAKDIQTLEAIISEKPRELFLDEFEVTELKQEGIIYSSFA